MQACRLQDGILHFLGFQSNTYYIAISCCVFRFRAFSFSATSSSWCFRIALIFIIVAFSLTLAITNSDTSTYLWHLEPSSCWSLYRCSRCGQLAAMWSHNCLHSKHYLFLVPYTWDNFWTYVQSRHIRRTAPSSILLVQLSRLWIRRCRRRVHFDALHLHNE